MVIIKMLFFREKMHLKQVNNKNNLIYIRRISSVYIITEQILTWKGSLWTFWDLKNWNFWETAWRL